MIILIIALALFAVNWHVAREHERNGYARWARFTWAMVGWCAFWFIDTVFEILK